MTLYRILYAFFKYSLLFFRPLLPQKMSENLGLRQFPFIFMKNSWDQRPTIWLHAASGEIEYLRPLIRELRSKYPKYKLFISFFSTSALNWIEQVDCDGWAPLPWDQRDSLLPLMEKISPKILLLARTDLWPELMNCCAQKQIPVVLVAATFSSGSKKTSLWIRPLMQRMLLQMQKVLVVSPADKHQALTLSPQAQVIVTGDSRYDQVNYRLQQNKVFPIPKLEELKNNAVIIAGSTWPEDEEILLPAFQKTLALHSKARLILVPHENNPEHLQQLKSQLHSLGLEFQKFSDLKIQQQSFTSQVLLVDEFGWLLDLYKIGTLAFIGGGFKAQVHSVMEALGSGLPTCFGPHHSNNREALEFKELQEMGHLVAQEVRSSEDLKKYFHIFFNLPKESLNKLQEKIKLQFQNRSNATPRILKELEPWL